MLRSNTIHRDLMAIPTIRQKRIRTDYPTPSPLQFFHSSLLTKSLRGTLVNVKDPLPTPEQRIVVYHIPCSDCPNAYVGQTGRQFSTRVKEHKDAVRRQDKNSLLGLHCLTTARAFDWDRASVIGKGATKHTRGVIEPWKPHVSINAKHSIPATELSETIGGDDGKDIPKSVE